MSKTALYAIAAVLTAFVLWTWLAFVPSLRRTTGQENKALEAKNKELDSMLGSKQKILDSLAQTSSYWETKFFTQLSDTNKVKIRYIAIKDSVNNLSGDASYLFFLERARLRKGQH